MNLYITKSKRKNKKYDLLDSDKKSIYARAEQVFIQTTKFIRIAIGKNNY